ncbi:MAG: thioredoxin [Saprospiraceae bacterium]|nr:thioredoxin [Saprospiraceae bacterium]
MANFKDLINSEKPVLIDFSAEWCGPCKMMAPILSELKTKVGDSSTIVKIDVDKNPEIAGALQIRSVPTLVIYQKGELKWRKSGVISAHELEQTLNSFSVEA